MNYMSVTQTAEKWDMTPRRVQVLCSQGRIEGAQKVGNVWTIPETSEKPSDARKKIDNDLKILNSDILIERVWAMPNNNTFDIKPISNLITEELTEGLWIDPFANKNKFAAVTNDISMEYDTDYHMDALQFLKMFDDNSVDGILYDPPFSPKEAMECYNSAGLDAAADSINASFWGNHKKEISRILKLGGKVITFSWNSDGIGIKYGFEMKRILLVPHGGWHNDTICTVEVKKHECKNKVIKDEFQELRPVPSRTDRLIEKDRKLISALNSLPIDYWDFKNADVRQYTHGIHNYPAMMVCPISRNILRLMSEIQEIDTLFDPFSGSGTVLVEGMLAGIKNVYGNDINPLALFLSKVKTTRLDIIKLQQEVQLLYARIEKRYEKDLEAISIVDNVMRSKYNLDLTAKNDWGTEAPRYLNKYITVNNLDIEIPEFKNIGYWFKPKVILLLSIIKKEINRIECKDIRDFVFVAFSETIRFVSNRRNGEFKMFRMQKDKVENFEPDVIKEFSAILNRNIEKMNNFEEACSEADSKSEVTIFKNSTTSLEDVPDNSVDVVITSPPYGDSRTTVAYGEYSRLSLQWLDLFHLSDKEIMSVDKMLMGGSKFKDGFQNTVPSQTLKKSLDIIKEVDLRRAGDVYSFYVDLRDAISAIAGKTKPGGYQFWVVGNRTVKGERLLTDKIIPEIADCYDMEYVYTVNRNIINKVMPSLNSPSNETGVKLSTMTNEHIVVLRKR